MKYAVVTFGCRVNQADSLTIEDALLQRGGVAASVDQADLVVVNTCSVTASADQGARQTVRRIARLNPDVKVVVTGCYASRCSEEVAALPNVVRVIANADKDQIGGAIDEIRETPTAERFGDGDAACGAHLAPGTAGRTAFTLRVQTGCDEACTYCIIPQTRGPGRSRPLPYVLEDVARAVNAGYKEIAITGVHLGSYGRDLRDDSSLIGLVRTLAGWPEEVLFRISSLEPMDCTSDLVDVVAQSTRLAPHFHLPLQHGADRVLGAMGRPYTTAYFRDLACRIREQIPDAALGSDIIVGFPGETDGLFEQMCALLEVLPLTYLHVFPYSDRPGTRAERLPGRANGAVVRERARRVRAIGERKALAFRAMQAGSTRRALTVDDGWAAVSDNYLKIRLESQQPRNTWVNVRIDAPAPVLPAAQ